MTIACDDVECVARLSSSQTSNVRHRLQFTLPNGLGQCNKVILVGNLGRDAELRYTPGGAAVATINMATTEVWNDKAGQRQEKTEWHRVVLWGKPAESLTEYLTKGKQIYVEGRLQTRQWDDKDGNKRYTTEIRGDQRRAARRRRRPRRRRCRAAAAARAWAAATRRARPRRTGSAADRRRYPVLASWVSEHVWRGAVRRPATRGL